MTREEILQQMDELRKKLAEGETAEDSSSVLGGETPEKDTKPEYNPCCNRDDFIINSGILLKYKGNAPDVSVPPEVTKICDGAFERSRVKCVVIPDGVKVIGSRAFGDCHSLECVIFPKSLTEIGEGAFEGSVLVNVAIPDGVTKIGGRAFYNCYKLKKVTVPKNVKIIEQLTFCGCEVLESVTIPDGVNEIGEGAFQCCSSLKDLILPDSLRVIGKNAFYGDGGLKTLAIPDGVKKICEGAFSNCKNLEAVTIPDSVKTIEDGAFRRSTKVTAFCEAKKKPHGWARGWANYDGLYFVEVKIVWNFKK